VNVNKNVSRDINTFTHFEPPPPRIQKLLLCINGGTHALMDECMNRRSFNGAASTADVIGRRIIRQDDRVKFS
jgi:hypothetical protein